MFVFAIFHQQLKHHVIHSKNQFLQLIVLFNNDIETLLLDSDEYI